MSKIVKITESEIVDLVKKIVKEQKATTRRKTIKEDIDDDDDYDYDDDNDDQIQYSTDDLFISHVGIPVNQVMVSLSVEDGDGDVNFTLEMDGDGNATIVDFYNYSDEIDDDVAKKRMEELIEARAFIKVPVFIGFNMDNGKLSYY
jgi:hypothetical protein